MGQPLRRTVAVGATPPVIPISTEKPLLVNASYKETAGQPVTVTLRGPDGDYLDPLAANGQGVAHDTRVTEIVLSGNGATVVIDVRASPSWIDPQFLTAEISGTVQVDSSTLAKDSSVNDTTAAVGAGTSFQEALWVNFPSGIPKASNGGILTGTS